MRQLQRAFFVWLCLTLAASGVYVWRMATLPVIDAVANGVPDDAALHVLTAFLFIVNPSAFVLLPAILFFVLRRPRRGGRRPPRLDLLGL